MANTNPESTVVTEEKPDEATEAGTEESAEQSTEEADEEVETESDSEDELPDWAREKLTKANSEAARYRTALREAEAKLLEAKTPEEFTAATGELTTAISNLERENVALKFALPDDLAELLKGETREELEEHAKKLQKYAPKTPGGKKELGGGLNPTEDPVGTLDPAKLAAEFRKRVF